MFRVNGSGGRQGEYSNEWLLQTNLTIGEVREMARHYGLEYSHEVVSEPHYEKTNNLLKRKQRRRLASR